MIMAFNGNGAGGGQDGPHNKRLCTGQEMIETVPLNSRNNNNNINVTDEPRRKREVATRPNHILLFTIINPVYPITVDVLHTICSPNGQVQRIVIFKKNGVQAMVEFDSIESATRAREALNGCDIYSGCCTLKIDYAKEMSHFRALELSPPFVSSPRSRPLALSDARKTEIRQMMIDR